MYVCMYVSAKTPDSRDKLTIFVITGSSSFRQKVRIDDGRGSRAHDFAQHEAAILRTLSSDNGENSENSLHVEVDVASEVTPLASASSSDLIAVIL